MASNKSRLIELDFLRGIAIILVLLRHQDLFKFTTNLGWIGVDLFFVLSGFLVSGLLFREHKKYGKINVKRFLIRRGFKIYPIYYLSLVLYLTPIIFNNKIELTKLIYDIFFIQNYSLGFGYLYAASWSLAVEEHFYFGLAILLWGGIKLRFLALEKTKQLSKVEFSIIILLIISFGFKLYNNIELPELVVKNFTMTHLRIDSLIIGVLISYWYYYRFERTKHMISSYKYYIYTIIFLCLSWVPFIDKPLSSFFVKTYGFIIIYIGFGLLLLTFLFTENMGDKLNKTFSPLVVKLVSKIGFCSYSIYVIHMFINSRVRSVLTRLDLPYFSTVYFITSVTFSVIIGFILTYKVEKYFLKIRDRYYPSRSNDLIKNISKKND